MCSEIPRELVAWMEAQTSPDSEDWTIIPDGKVIVKSLPRANCRPLGCITVILCADHAQNGTLDLLGWLTHMAKRKEFSVVSVAGPALTAEAIAILKQRFDHWVSAQRDPSHQQLH